MKQLLQSLKDGTTEIADVPAPQLVEGSNLIKTSTTLVSAGTERMIVEFGKGNLIQKARSQPEKVKQVLEKAKTDGVMTTYDAVSSKLDQPVSLGYCNVGKVIETKAEGFSVGDRVVSNGKHAELVSVPKNLCAKIPDNVTDEAAAFTVLAAIGLQGVRLAKLSIGENVVVFGLGLIGLLTVQILRAQGCKVLGIDFDEKRLQLANSFGAETINMASGENILDYGKVFSKGNGVDAVIITAATKSTEPITLAAKMSRKRGRIILVGLSGLSLDRSDFYEKELSFQVSCSYGPGRYDPNYEERGLDYPIGFVRWTEQRNFEAVLDLMSAGFLKLTDLISHRMEVSDGEKAFNLLTSGEHSLGILLNFYDPIPKKEIKREVSLNNHDSATFTSTGINANLGFLGAGNYAGRVLIPAFQKAGANLDTLVSSGGVSAFHFGRKYRFKTAATDSSLVFNNSLIDTIVIATRHNSHAELVLAGLRAGKHIFCEKPLCLKIDELLEIEKEVRLRKNQILMVGFNRRFSPQIKKMKMLLSSVSEPKNFIMTINAGEIKENHWTQSIDIGGRRIIGEACHFIDLIRFLAGASIIRWHATSLGNHPAVQVCDDKVVITLELSDGSVGVINYLANGHKSVSKERLEVFSAGRVLRLDNFLRLYAYGWKGFRGSRLWRQDKGQLSATAEFVKAIKVKGDGPIPVDEIFEVSRVSIEIGRSLM